MHDQIIASLKTDFAALDASYIERSVVWAKGRDKAVEEFKNSNSPREMGTHAYYEKLFNIAGGKAWYNIFDGRNWGMIEPIVRKNCQRVIEKRNHNIAAKLEKAGITEMVGEPEISRTSDGFHGCFKVKTDKGPKTVEIQTIVAGGYNIQCLHNRTLVKVK